MHLRYQSTTRPLATRMLTKHRRAASIGLAALAVIAGCGLSGCASTQLGAPASTTASDQGPLSGLTLLDDPKSYLGPSTAVLPSTAIVPVSEDPQQSFPASTTSYDRGGNAVVKITDTSRVVALDLSGSIAATVWGLGFGSTLVGRDESTTFPGTEHLETVTSGGHTVNAERVIGLHPSLVITDGTVGPREVIEQLRDVGITVVFVKNDPSFGGAEELARQVAAAYGAPQVGEALASRITQEVNAKIAEIAAIAPHSSDRKLRIVFLYLRGSAGVYYLFGEESGADQLIEGLGGIDVAGELGWTGMKPLTDEAMVAANPDLVLVMSKGIASVGGVDQLLRDKPAIALTNAGEHRRFVDMDDGSILSFGPRSASVLDALARAIYAPSGTAIGG